MQSFARFGEPNSPGRALEEREAKLNFQIANGLADGRSTHTKYARGFGEALVLSD